MLILKRNLTPLASLFALLFVSSPAFAQVKPALPLPDRPGLNPPKVFPPNQEKAVEFPYQAQPSKAALMIVTAHPDDEGFFPGLIPICNTRREAADGAGGAHERRRSSSHPATR